jgi:hypothetical protein
VQGGEAQPDLEPEGEGQEEGGDAHEEDAGDQQPGDERPLPEQGGVDQRRAVGRLLAPLPGREGGQGEHRGSHRREGPGGPVEVAALHQRVDEQQQAGGCEPDPHQVEPQRPRRARLAQEERRRDQRADPDGDVDQEDRPPAEAEQVALDQQPADQRAGDGGQADGGAEDAEGSRPLPGREGHLDHREDLREHHRPHQALEHAGADQHAGALGGAAEGGGDREPGHAEHEQAPAAEDVAEAAAGDQHDREGELVAGEHPLDLAVGGVEVALHRGDGDVDDADVDQLHEAGDQHHRQGGPAARIAAGGVARPVTGGGGGRAHA